MTLREARRIPGRDLAEELLFTKELATGARGELSRRLALCNDVFLLHQQLLVSLWFLVTRHGSLSAQCLSSPNALGRRCGASTRQHAAVDRQHGPRDPAGIPARQEQNRLHYVLGLAVPA